MNETKTEWRDCADPDELAAAVAAGVEVEVQRRVGQPWQPTRSIDAAQFAGFISTGHRYRLPTSWSPEPPAPDDGPLGIYVASRTIHAAMWKELRSEGVPIISTWLDEAGAGETEDFSDLWRRCVDEVKRAGRLVAFHSEGDVWKGAFIEIGVALGAGVPVTVVGDPPGSWPAHPLVSQARSAREAVGLASPGEPSAPPAPDDLAARARRHAYTHPESRHIIEELLDEVEMLRHSVDVATDAAPVPPWPGAVLSGLVDEDGVPTWLALAPNVLGEAVRTCIDFPWFICGSDNAVTPYWVEVRAPRAVPEPETERVPVWEAMVGERTAISPDGTPMELSHGDVLLYTNNDGMGGFLMYDDAGHAKEKRQPVAPDGTVEVLKATP